MRLYIVEPDHCHDAAVRSHQRNLAAYCLCDRTGNGISDTRYSIALGAGIPALMYILQMQEKRPMCLSTSHSLPFLTQMGLRRVKAVLSSERWPC